MPALSTYAQNKVSEHLAGKTAFALPTCFLALATAAPSAGTTGSTLAEPSGGSYARVALAGDWASASGGSISNNVVINFPQSTSAWGTLTHAAVCDAASAGNVLFFAPLSASITGQSSQTVSFPVSSLQFSVT